MIYTVGLISKYEAAIDRGGAVKLAGGWVWRSREEAHAYLVSRNALAERRVYGVIADWETDTREAVGEPTRILTTERAVVRI